MAWAHPGPLRLPKCSSFRARQSRFHAMMGHPFRPQRSRIPPMLGLRRWLPRASRPEPPCRRARRATQYGAVEIVVAAGAQAAHPIRKITPAPMRRPVRRSTQIPHDLQSPTPAPIGRPVRKSTLAPRPSRLRRPTPAPTRHKSTRVQRAAGRQAPTEVFRENKAEARQGGFGRCTTCAARREA